MRSYGEWSPDSACRSGTAQKEFKKQSRKAKQHCNTCPVKRDCLNYALLYEEAGIWGGTTEIDRNQILLKVPQVRDLLKLEALRAGILEHRYTIEEYWASVRQARKFSQGSDRKQELGVPQQVFAPEPSGVEFVVPEEEYYIQWVS